MRLGRLRDAKSGPVSSKVEDVRHWSFQLGLALAILTGIVAFTWVTDEPVKLVHPYALATGLVAWRYGLGWSFAFSALATLVALWSGAFPTHPTSQGHEAVEGLITYAQLSFVSILVTCVRSKRCKKAR